MNNITENIKIIDLALYLKKEKTLIISDLQLGYEENLMNQGVLLPFHQFKDIGARLEEILRKIKPKKIVINGDLKHEFGRVTKQEWQEVLKLIDFLGSKCSKLIIIKGNHDTMLDAITSKKEVEIYKSYKINNILITHGHEIPDKAKDSKIIIIGHSHPAITISDGNVKETYKCFLKGKWKNKILIVQPSFFTLTEGSDVLKYDLNSPFIGKNIKNFDVWAVADKVFYFGKIKNILQS